MSNMKLSLPEKEANDDCRIENGSDGPARALELANVVGVGSGHVSAANDSLVINKSDLQAQSRSLDGEVAAVRDEIRATSERIRLIELERELVGCVMQCKRNGSLNSQGTEWEVCFRKYCASGVDVLDGDLPRMQRRCEQLAPLDQADLRVKEADLRAKEADLRAMYADLRVKQADLRAKEAYLDERMTLLMKERLASVRLSPMQNHSRSSSCPPKQSVDFGQWLSVASAQFEMTKHTILDFVNNDCLMLPEVEELRPVPTLIGTKIPDFRRISWVVDDGRISESKVLSPAFSILERVRMRPPEKPYDVSILVGVSGCGKTRTMFDIAREDYALYLDFGCKDVSKLDQNDIGLFLECVSVCEHEVKVQMLIDRLIAARLTAVILALETCEDCLIAPSQILRMQLNRLSVVSRKFFQTLQGYETVGGFASDLGKYLEELVTRRLRHDTTHPDGCKPTGTCFMLIDEAGVLLSILQHRFPRMGANAGDSRRGSLYHVFIQRLCSFLRFPLVIGGTMASLLDLPDIVSPVADPSVQLIKSYVNYPMFDANSVRSFVLQCIAVSDENRQDLELVSHSLVGRPRFAASFVQEYVSERSRTLKPVPFLPILRRMIFSQVKEDRSGTVLFQLCAKMEFRKTPELVAAIWLYSCKDERLPLPFRRKMLPAEVDYLPQTAGLLPLSYADARVVPFAAHEPLLEDACLSWFANSELDPVVCKFANLASEIGSTYGKVMETILGLHFCTMRFNQMSFGSLPGVLFPFASEFQAVVPQVRAIRQVEASDRVFDAVGGHTTVSFLKMFPVGWCYVLPEQRFGPDGICILPLNDALLSGGYAKSGFYVLFLGSKTTVAEGSVSPTAREANARSVSVTVVDASEAPYVDDFKKYVQELIPVVGQLHGFLCISVCVPTSAPSPTVRCQDVQWDGRTTKEYSVSIHSDNCRAFLGDKLGESVLQWAWQRRNRKPQRIARHQSVAPQ
jgi:hypothetical protein